MVLLSACQPNLDIPVDTTEPEATDELEATEEVGLSGQIQIAGSTTVQPLAEVLGEAFMAENPTIEIQEVVPVSVLRQPVRELWISGTPHEM